MGDWIDDFLDYAEGELSPDTFKLWTAISIVSGALERRCWALTKLKPLYPNLFIMLVAPPAVGKGIIDVAQEFWRLTKGLKLASDDVSPMAFIDNLVETKKTSVQNGHTEEYHFIQVAVEEFSVFIKAYDMTFLSILTKLYNCGPTYQQTRRTGKLNLDILRPGVNMITGVQPGILAMMLPPEAWTQGFMGRTIMVYAAKAPDIPPFTFISPDIEEARSIQRTSLLNRLAQLTQLRGLFQWSPEAMGLYQEWYEDKLAPVPTHSKLEHYNGRREMFVCKLAMISGVSSSGGLYISGDDFTRARAWLLAAETRMPDIFRAMVGRSDNDVIEEAYIYAWQVVGNGKPLTKAKLATFLAARVPQEKVESLIMLMITMGCIEETGAGDGLKPLTREEQIGVE